MVKDRLFRPLRLEITVLIQIMVQLDGDQQEREKTGHCFPSSPSALALKGSVKMQLSGRVRDERACSDSLARRPSEIKLLLHYLDSRSVL